MKQAGGVPMAKQDSDPSATISVQIHPIVSAIGVFADDPLWEKFLEELAKSRREQEQVYAEIE